MPDYTDYTVSIHYDRRLYRHDIAAGRVEILEQLIKEHSGKCIMDYPEDMFKGYDEALAKAAAASREYVQWLAQQGYPSR